MRFRLVRGVTLADKLGGACEQQVKDELSVTQDIDRQNAAARPDADGWPLAELLDRQHRGKRAGAGAAGVGEVLDAALPCAAEDLGNAG